jgi:MYXO-CTERM domain-containing protein
MARRLVVVVGILIAGPVATRPAAADPGGDGSRVVTGEVIAATSRWTADGSRIVTTATIRGLDGTTTTVSQLGGTVGTLAMRTLPGPAVLAPGMTAQVLVRDAATRTGAHVLAVEDVGVLHDDFVRTGPTPDGHYLYWASGCVKMAYGAEGTLAISGEDEFPVIEDSMTTWNDGVAGCSYMHFVSLGPVTDHEVGTDRFNIIKFRDATWCRPAVDDDPARCYSPTTAGITTVVYVDDAGNDRDGEIVDADVEINGVDFAISVGGVSLSDATCDAELQNTLTHELGHVLGLEHTCRVPGDPPRVDDQGNDVPLCTDVVSGDEITEATMYNFQACGETKKESLSQDDIDGVCTVYPIADDPHECKGPGDSGGCSCGTGHGPTGPAALVVVVGLVLSRRRRR